MGVVVPLRVAGPGGALRAEKARRVVQVLQREVERAATAGTRARRAGDLADDVRLTRIVHLVYRVEAQPVKVILLQPVEGVVDEELAHRAAVGAVEVDRRAPGSRVTLVEELRRVPVQVVA